MIENDSVSLMAVPANNIKNKNCHLNDFTEYVCIITRQSPYTIGAHQLNRSNIMRQQSGSESIDSHNKKGRLRF